MINRITSYENARDNKLAFERGYFTAMPEDAWERELQAVKRIREVLHELYG